MTTKGTIYLIQPAELVGTERFKIGCSSKNDLNRCKKGYKIGTRYIAILECEMPFALENEIKKRFNTKFKIIAGREYFEGCENDIKQEFYDVISKFTSNNNTIPYSSQPLNNTIQLTPDTLHNTLHICNKCNAQFTSRQELHTHKNTNTCTLTLLPLATDTILVNNINVSTIVCDKCHKDLKYSSLLQRHQNKLKPCIANTPTNNNDNENIDDNNLLKKFQDTLNKAKTLQDTTAIINEFSTYFNTNNTQTTTPTQTITPTKKLQTTCLTCNHTFYDRQGLYRHNTHNKCKGTLLPQVTNNITNNNITNNVNPFKCESLSHITFDNFKDIYKSDTNINLLLCYYIYECNQNNISFYKNNINKKFVSILNSNMEIETMTDDQFIIILKDNINDSNIELFYNFKNDMTHTEILTYMTNMIVYKKKFINNKLANKEYNDTLAGLLDTAFRDKDKKKLINNIIKQLNLNTDTKQILKHNNYNILKQKLKKNKEYHNTTTDNTTDDKNLNKLKITVNDIINEEHRLRLEANTTITDDNIDTHE